MEDDASGKAELLLARIRALARRGAMLRRQADGTGLIEQSDKRRPPEPVLPGEFLRMIDQGWIRASGADQFVISRSGATALRNLLNNPVRARPTFGARTSASTSNATSRTAAAGPGIDLRESPLAWLAQRRDKDGRPLISSHELEAGERLRADFERALMGQRVTGSWNPAAMPSRQSRGAPGVGMEIADVVIAARQRVEAALKAVGPEMSDVLLDVCCFLKGLEQAERNGGWPRRAGKVVLQLALKQLARHYGILPRTDESGVRVRSWSTQDYRPAADKVREPPG